MYPIGINTNAEIAQLVERFPEEEDVPSSSLGLGTSSNKAFVVQWIEQARPKGLMSVRFRPRAQCKILETK